MPMQPLAVATLWALAMQANAADTQLTVYSGDFDGVAASLPSQGMSGFALVRQSHQFDLRSGDNTLTLSGLPVAIDAAGVRLIPRGDDITVTGQRFDFALADQSELLRRAVGQRVTVEQAAGDTRATYTGTLLAAGDGLTLALDDGRVRVLSSYTGFELATLPDGLYAKPTLRWSVRSARAGSETFTLDYPTAGLAWRAEYLATLSGGASDCRMDFSGAAQVLNRSGTSFDAAALTLVAGEPNVQRSPPPQTMMFKTASMEMADAAPEPQPSGEYHAYRLPGRIDLPDASVQRVPLLSDADAVTCMRRYESRSPMGYFQPSSPIIQPDFGPNGEQPVTATLEFTNRKEKGLGIPLPAGRLRVFDRGADGAENFLGEALLQHTAAGREVRAELGQAFDLSVERTRVDLQLDADRLGLNEAVKFAVRNAKPAAATIRVIESLPRWTDWEITEASHEWTKVDAQTIRFDVPVPAAGEATVSYRVRYRWPESMKP